MNNNIEPNIQSQSNYNEIKTNEIPPEYREMYLRQIEQERQQELQRRQQELPPEYKDMYMKQIEQERQQKEIPPAKAKTFCSCPSCVKSSQASATPFSLTTRVTIIPAASEFNSAGICERSPSPTLNKVY